MKIGLMDRQASVQPASIDEANRTVTVLFSTGAAVRRWTWDGIEYIEELAMGDANIRLGRLNQGANLLDSHGSWSLRSVLGVTERGWIEGGSAWATVRFSSRPEVQPIWDDVRSGILRSVSVGYMVHKTQRSVRDGMPVYRHVDWEPMEISLVAIPADPGAGVRSQLGLQQVEVVEPAAAVGYPRRNAARARMLEGRLRSGK